MNRAEYIKTLNTEELAKFIDGITSSYDFCTSKCAHSPLTYNDCHKCILDWLYEPIKTVEIVKHGEWLPHPTDEYFQVCSVCRKRTRRKIHYNEGVYGGYDVELSYEFCGLDSRKGEGMSILIKDMKMPKDGAYWCEIGVAGDIATITIHGEDRKSFHLVELPDHGDLIDRDELSHAMYHEAFEVDSKMQKWDSGCWIRYKMFERQRDSAPVVIPAERSE